MATCKVSLALEELIGLPNYSNVRVGPAHIEREVEDTPEARKQAFDEIADELNTVLGEQRTAVLNAVKAFAASGGYGDVRKAG